MSDDAPISIAIVSDLHCYAHMDPKARKESFLLAGALRSPPGRHPVQSLLGLIKEQEDIRADVIVCPGDLANKICTAGMVQAWDHLKELQTALGCKHLLTTLGNHDVDSRKEHGSDPFKIPKNVNPDFPLPDGPEKNSFWAQGFYFSHKPELSTDFVVLNTVVNHQDEKTAKRGTFDSSNIASLKNALEHRKATLYTQNNLAHKICVMHHHPILHSSVNFGSGDVLEFGDQILSVLADYGFRVILHGHRHDPRISRVLVGGDEQIVFASGAFSAFLNEWSSVTRNLFHIAELNVSTSSSQLKGRIRTWEFNYGSGWSPSTEKSALLPHEVGLALPPQKIDLDAIVRACGIASGNQLRKLELLKGFPELGLLLPVELKRTQEELARRGHKLVVSSTGSIEACGKIV